VLEDQPFCLDELIQERAAWIMPQADAHRFTITLHHSQACPFKGDAFRMGQVVTILMENALRYGRDGGHLDVTLHYASGQYILEFRDDGPGVSPSSCRKCSTVLAGRSSPRAALRRQRSRFVHRSRDLSGAWGQYQRVVT
jgi:signal transduction histidine kinase